MNVLRGRCRIRLGNWLNQTQAFYQINSRSLNHCFDINSVRTLNMHDITERNGAIGCRVPWRLNVEHGLTLVSEIFEVEHAVLWLSPFQSLVHMRLGALDIFRKVSRTCSTRSNVAQYCIISVTEFSALLFCPNHSKIPLTLTIVSKLD
jgi:hypothetical protein